MKDMEKLKAYFYSNIATIFWSSFLLLGGGIFVGYFAHIEYMPDFDLKSSVAVTAAAAVTALIITAVLLVVMILPGAFWGNTWGSESKLKEYWADEEGNRTIIGLTIWFALPLGAIYAGALVGLGYGWYGTFIPGVAYLGFVIYLMSKDFDAWDSVKHTFLQFGTTLVASLFLFLPFLLVLGLSVEEAGLEAGLRVPAWFAGLLSGLFIIFVNVMAATNPKHIKTLYWYLGLAAITLFVVFSLFERFHRIPVRVMEIYKFGNIPASEMVLKKDSCDALSALGIKVNQTSENVCVVNEIRILSRLGKEAYLQHKIDGSTVNFTVASSDILSWAIREKSAARNDGASNNSVEPTREDARGSR